jgi:hypothetical protein
MKRLYDTLAARAMPRDVRNRLRGTPILTGITGSFDFGRPMRFLAITLTTIPPCFVAVKRNL